MRPAARWTETLLLETRQAFRSLSGSPGLVAAVVVTLGLGVGANAGMFEMVDQLLLRPPPHLMDADRVHRLHYTRTSGDRQFSVGSFSYPGYRALSKTAVESTAIETLAAQAWRHQIAALGDRPREVLITGITGSYWGLFGMAPALGRFFGPEEDQPPEGSAVAVLAHHFWRAQYGGDPDVIGESITVGEKRYTIVGVAPEGFRGIGLRTPSVFVPLTAAAPTFVGEEFAERLGTTWITIITRTADPGDVAALNQLTRSIFAVQAERRGEAATRELGIEAVHLPIQIDRGPYPQAASRYAVWLLGMSLVLVLIALANVATLLTGRHLRRQKDAAVRAALGVSAGRAMLHPVLESLLLATLAGLAAIPIGHWTVAVLARTLLPDYAGAIATLELRSIAYGMAVVLVTGLLAAALPAWRTRATNLGDALRAGRSAGRSRSRAQQLLPVVQAALSAVLLVGAGLFVRSVINGATVELGYEADRVLVVEPTTSGAFDPFRPAEEFGFSIGGLMAEAAAVPGVESVAISTTPPFVNNEHTAVILASGDTAPAIPELAASGSGQSSTSSGPGNYNLNQVSPGYFETVGTRIVQGRPLGPDDRRGAAPVIVVSQSVARLVWPADNPAGHAALGECVRLGADTVPCSRVVGVAEDARRADLQAKADYQIYQPWDQGRQNWRGTLVVRTAGPSAAMVGPVAEALQSAVPSNVLVDVRPLSALVDEQLANWAVGARVFAVFGLLALAMAGVGLFSVVAYEVSQRMHEFGVRMALGAVTRDLMALVLRKGVATAALGAGVGLAAAALLADRVQDLLFDTPARDPVTFGVVAGLLVGAAAAASLWPAVRAGRVDPRKVLKAE